MGRRSGKFSRFISRFFKERQIYHRSDGVVHFISMSTKTQIALAVVVGAALLWVAYSSVNVVFKEQIIVAKERDSRIMETTYNKRLHDAQRAYDDVNAMNHIIQQNFDETMADISARHHLLRNMVERKVNIEQGLDQLAAGLAEAGGPAGEKPTNNNRIMIDVKAGEPTPRQSRLSALRKEALLEADRKNQSNGTGVNSEALDGMREASMDLHAEQTLLLASIESKAVAKKANLEKVLASTGVDASLLVTPAKISNLAFAQGGPFIDPASDTISSTRFLQHANRAAAAVDELEAYYTALKNIPLSSPLTVSRRFTSGFGIRRDPMSPNRYANHYGIDFGARYASPITVTAEGVVKSAGRRSGWGLMVEVDHGNGFVTRYAHMSKITVKRGQKLKLHDKVGELGNTGRSTGAHLHYEILFRGKHLNPKRFIEAGRYVFES